MRRKITSVGEEVEKLEPLYSLRKLKVELLSDLTIPLVNMHPQRIESSVSKMALYNHIHNDGVCN